MKTQLNVKHYLVNIFIFISLVCILFLSNFQKPIENLDELWKYQWARNVVLGYMPYRDYNVVTTPLYLYLFSIPLFIFNELIAFRLWEALGWAVLGYLLFTLLSKRFNKAIAYSFTLILLILFTLVYYVYDYNTLAITFIIAALNILEKDININVKYFLCGFLCACTDLTKQTVGVLFTVGCFILILGLRSEKKKKILTFLLGFIIPNMLFLFYLIISKSFVLFFDQALFGLNSFTNNATLFVNHFGILGWIYASIPLIFFLYSTIDIFKYRRTQLYAYVVAELAILLLCVPLCDVAHYMYVFVFFLFVFMLTIGEKHKGLVKKKYTYSISIIGFYCFVLFILRIPITGLEDNIISDINGLKYIPINESSYANITGIDAYMKTNYDYSRVYYFTAGSCYFAIKNDISRGVYDLFLNGNMGTKSPIDYVKDIQNIDGIIVLRRGFDKENRQNPSEILTYITDNFELVDTYSIYDIYTSKK